MAKLLTAATPISYYLVVVNIVAFILYGTDKAKAMHHQWRIKEAVLIGIAFVGGAFGAFAGMIVFHHKTRKMKFRILVPIAIIIWLTFGGFLAGRDVVGLTKTDRPKNEYNGTEITPYHSSVDKDGDGTDDQTDILTNALVYVKKYRFTRADIIRLVIRMTDMVSVQMLSDMRLRKADMICGNW